jgi:hypothetical protein
MTPSLKLLALLFITLPQCAEPEIQYTKVEFLEENPPVYTHVISEESIDPLNESRDILFSFTIEHKGNFGKAFIANHQVWTANHIIENIGWLDLYVNDIAILSDSKLHGLSICNQPHTKGDRAYSVAQNGHIEIALSGITGEFRRGICRPEVISGDSGSPVLCYIHRKVIGIISGVEINNGNIIWIIPISDERTTSCEKENEKETIKNY